MALMPSASAISGPGDIIPAPVKYVTSGEGYSLKKDGSDIRVHLADRRFSKEIKGLNIPEFARDEAYRLTVGKRGSTSSPSRKPVSTAPGRASG